MKIQELTLFSENIQAQWQFYAEVLGFPCLKKQPDALIFKTGNSRLVIEKDKACGPVHFAFVIPGKSYQKANAWLRSRVDLLTWQGQEIIDFPDWHAKAQYFYDADRNIVEFIARTDVSDTEVDDFSARCVLQVGEVGLPSTNPEALYTRLNSMYPLPKYDGDFRRFGAAGSPEGLFILVHREEKKWFPTGESISPAYLRVRGDLNFEFNNETITEINNAL